MKKKRMISSLVIFGTIMICCISASASSLKTYKYTTKNVSVDTYSDYLSRVGLDKVYFLAHQYGKDAEKSVTPVKIYTYENNNYKDVKEVIYDTSLRLEGGYSQKIEENGKSVVDADGITVRVNVEGFKYNYQSK